MPQTTLLSIDDITFPDFSTRSITMTLKPVAAGELERDVNGNLVDMTLEQFRKFEATIEGEDHEAPEWTDVWRGKIVEVTCIPQLGVETDTDGSLVLTMMVDDWETSREEYPAETGWTIHLIEV